MSLKILCKEKNALQVRIAKIYSDFYKQFGNCTIQTQEEGPRSCLHPQDLHEDLLLEAVPDDLQLLTLSVPGQRLPDVPEKSLERQGIRQGDLLDLCS